MEVRCDTLKKALLLISYTHVASKTENCKLCVIVKVMNHFWMRVSILCVRVYVMCVCLHGRYRRKMSVGNESSSSARPLRMDGLFTKGKTHYDLGPLFSFSSLLLCCLHACLHGREERRN